ncbi:chromo (CHRromatin organization MOdifier) domain-containing protein [Pochonia chlamydosporia 170]|uniref:Chromo (CHRromatin organization MOdifier) domain-containing protein n=1 Tax=Pochonia chlamydosporia 170 TaxID=1380566 RepID=A0A179EXF5_METCM|nr:chromo (CHRromatin organization MOdifier) domain-containing protein [Pochonia chlamydosporia 170]OAQ57822.1 chromo (CHRromatin organization MOdifier) domain-containing protein [Pochonia chlamydosporia 170]
MARVVDYYPSSDDDLGNIGSGRTANSRVTPTPGKTILFPKTDDLVPKVKATPSNRRIRRLNAAKFAPENPLFKSWTGENSSPLEASTKKSASLLGRRTVSRPNTEKCGDDAELIVPNSATTSPVPKPDKGVQGHMAHPCDATEALKEKTEDQLTGNVREADAHDSAAMPCEFVEDSQPHDAILDKSTYIVERIISHKGNGRRRRYFVKWQDYAADENSWVTRKDFVDKTFPRQYDEQCKRSTVAN